MNRSAAKYISPMKSQISYVGQEPDSPSRSKIKLLSDKWGTIQQSIDIDKVEKKNVLEDRVKIIEDVLAQEKPKEEHRYKVLKDQILRLQDMSLQDRAERENFDLKKEQNLKSLADNIENALKQERTIKVQQESKLYKSQDERFNQLSVIAARNGQGYQERLYSKFNEIRQQIQLIRGQIDSERKQR